MKLNDAIYLLFESAETNNELTKEVGGYEHVTVSRDIKVVDKDLVESLEQLPRGTVAGDCIHYFSRLFALQVNLIYCLKPSFSPIFLSIHHSTNSGHSLDFTKWSYRIIDFCKTSFLEAVLQSQVSLLLVMYVIACAYLIM